MSEQDNQEEGILICGIAQELEFVTAGSTLAYFCSECRQRVAVSLSGQRKLEARKLKIVCLRCAEIPEGDHVKHEFSSGTLQDVIEEMRTARPNT